VGGGDVGYVLGGWRRCRLCIGWVEEI